MNTCHYVLAVLVACGCPTIATAQQSYPNKPVRLIVGFAPGGNTDTVARIIGQKLGERLGTPVVVDNRGGAGGTIGTDIAARATADGYTMTMGTTTTHAIAVAAYAKLPYDPVKDFDPIALVATAPYMLVVPSKSPVKNLKDFIAHVKANPGKLNYGSAGTATTTQLVMVTLASRAGLDMTHIPFKGNGPATTAVLAGEVHALFGAVPPLLPHVKSGRVRALAVSSGKRLESAPNVPTVAESGFPGFDMTLWLGFFTPNGTPRPVLKRLETELVAVATAPDTKQQMSRQGLEATSLGSAALGELVRTEIENYKKVFKTAGIEPQ
ncbi:MAG TPA: tripartite tricarboxylate transporter substrate binding protein [Burkholderiales bacterium]|nr:tripartite tricarboxylate transporter substrate binding protein [Burkholderiales bacterium]